MTYKINEIEGIGSSFGEKLVGADINTTDDLLNVCCDPKGRKSVAEKTGISEQHILTWTNMADLMRISGIGKQFAELLKASGVDTVKELQHRNAENLATAMKKVNDEKNLAKTSPVDSVVAEWISAAKTTPPKITY